MRSAPILAGVLAAHLAGVFLVACTDGRALSTSRNSDGSPKELPPGPPSSAPHTLVLAYDAFGPQAMAGELLGPEWWQWEPGGSWESGDRFDVRVVVYRDRSADEVAAAYPSVAGKADYRYVTHADALAHLDRSIEACAGEPTLTALQAELAATRARIVQALGE
ncbi:MAG TPA: hypothetical protein PKW35_21525 [Nannocystaceae bacterium]|nr:hypothetical protein [Nannocystaceae bacterium]